MEYNAESPVSLEFFTARKRSLRRLCFYRCVSVHGGGVHVRGEGGVRGRCACMAGGMCATHPPQRHYEIQSVNARVVRILLECILVLNVFTESVEFSDKKYLSLKGLEPATSCVTDQDATTVPARHM